MFCFILLCFMCSASLYFMSVDERHLVLQTRSSEAHSRAGVPGLGSTSPRQLLPNPSRPLGVETYLLLKLLPPWAPSDPPGTKPQRLP